MQDRFVYAGTTTLKNRFGVRDSELATDLEYASFVQARELPVANFTADLAGLKAVHATLFGQIYEWAGQARNERVTVDGKSFKPEDHVMIKGDTVFSPASLAEHGLPNELERGKAKLDVAHQEGTLTKAQWAEITADQVGAINYAHPFREGNGRAMRRFVELSAEQYGFQARLIGGPEWIKASSEAMDVRKTGRLQAFIGARTTEKGAVTHQEADMAERLDTPVLDKAARVTQAAEETVARIKDPAQRRVAQQLLKKLRTQEAKLHRSSMLVRDADYDQDFER